MQGIRNISRNQDRTSPSYITYKPLPGCEALSYVRNGRGRTGMFILDRTKLGDQA